MIKKTFLTAAIAAATLSSAVAYASDVTSDSMEKCKVVINGQGAIKEGKCDSGGNNKAGDPEAWIMVPKGECENINKGDLSGVSDEIKDKIDMSMMPQDMSATKGVSKDM